MTHAIETEVDEPWRLVADAVTEFVNHDAIRKALQAHVWFRCDGTCPRHAPITGAEWRRGRGVIVHTCDGIR